MDRSEKSRIMPVGVQDLVTLYGKYIDSCDDKRVNKSRYLLGNIREIEIPIETEVKGKIGIFVENEVIYATSAPSPLHENITKALGNVIYNGFLSIFGYDLLKSPTSSAIPTVNRNFCGTKFGKCPDDCYSIGSEFCTGRRNPFLVMEIGVHHEDADLLLREGGVILNVETDVDYLLLLNVVMSDSIVQYLDFFFCKRLNAPDFKRPRCEMVKFIEQGKHDGDECSSKFGRRMLKEHEILAKTNEELGEYYGLIVLSRKTIYNGNAHEDIVLEFETEVILGGTSLNPRLFPKIIRIVIPKNLIRSLFKV